MAVEDARTNADLEREVAHLRRELAEARDELTRSREREAAAGRALDQARGDEAEGAAREAATREILRAIAGSPADLQHVLDSLVATAARLCEVPSACLLQYDRGALWVVAACGVIGEWMRSDAASEVARRGIAATPESISGRAMVERRSVHVPDIAVAGRGFPDTARDQVRIGHRAQVSTPLLRKGEPIGILAVQRFEPGPFTEAQIKLLETFADQAVIAIENARLFGELQDRNRDLAEALEQQTATAEILRVIASSPSDLKPVFDAIAERAARLCEAEDVLIRRVEGDLLLDVAHHGSLPVAAAGAGLPIGDSVAGRAVTERRTIHLHDRAAVAQADFPGVRARLSQFPHRTVLATPLLREGGAIGVIVSRRLRMQPFTDRQVQLLETFADQAAIAIENARLLGELQERTRELARSVGELRALNEIGQAVSSSLDLGRVLETIIARAVELAGGDGGAVYDLDELAGEFRLRATCRMDPALIAAISEARTGIGDQGVVGRAARARRAVQVADLRDSAPGPLRDAILGAGFRAVLAVPLMREERIVGALVVRRRAPGEFPRPAVELVETFASQSVLAVENARLFREVADKSRQLEEVSRHKSEFLANMSHELRTPLNAVIGFSEVLIERMFGELNDRQDEYLRDILSSGQHLLSLINDILDLSKVEAGRMELEVETFSLREALENGLTMLRERAGRHGITLALEVDPELDVVEADERKVKQVVFNLLSNAVKFTPAGGSVTLAARRGDGAVEMTVADTGVGIAPEDLPHVFDEFRQVGQAKHEGTGLGLALTKKLVELHGGTIRARSEVGVGSAFTVTLPQPRVGPETGPS